MDDDSYVVESDIATRQRKSRAKKPMIRVWYDVSKENAHEQMELFLCFKDVHQFRKALANYHIVNRRDFTYLRNTPERVIAYCKSDDTCPFFICSSQVKGETTHCIRLILLPHTCVTTQDSSRINSTWLSEIYEDAIRSDPNMKITALIDMVMRDYGIEISKDMAYRAKNKALNVVVGNEDKQYLRLRDYLHTVIEKNPGSRCQVWSFQPSKPGQNPRFHGLFFCLQAQIEGFLGGCRPFIGKRPTVFISMIGCFSQ